MAKRRNTLIRPKTLVDLGARALSVAVDTLVPGPIGSISGTVIDVLGGAVSGGMERNIRRTLRQEAVTELGADLKKLEADLMRTRRFLARTAPMSSQTGIISAAPGDARTYDGLRKALLQRVSGIESSALNVSPHLDESERGLVSRDLAEVTGIIHDVACGESKAPLTEQVDRLERATGIVGRIVEGL